MREQWCCGGPAAEMGYADLARKHAEHNVADWRAVGAKRIIAPDPHDYIAFTEDYPRLFGDDYEFEIVLGVELIAELVRDGKIELTQPVERTVTYHDPCRLNKRKGVHEAPRELLRAIPGLTFKDVDRVTQWSYCSGGGGGLPIEKPEITAEIARRRVERANRARGRRPDQRVPVVGAATLGSRHARGHGPVRARRDLGGRDGDRMIAAVDASVLDELRAIIGDEDRVLDNVSSRAVRTRVPAPFPVHRWADHMPDVAVLPKTAEEVSEVVKLANRLRLPIVPRAGGTGLADGAVPLRGGILVDVKLMNQIHEIDLVDRTVTVGPGINMLKLNERLRPHGVFYPDDPASYPCSLVGGRIGTGGWSLLGARYGHTRDLVISMEVVLPTGEIVEIAEGGGRKLRKSSTGLTLKHLFTGHQGTLGICTQATLELVPRPETEFAAFFAFADYMDAYRTTGALTKSGLATLAGVVLFDEWKLRYLRRDDEAYIPQPEDVRAVVAVAMYGRRAEVEPASKIVMELGRADGGKYLGDEISQGDWASRHDRYATPLHGRTLDGQAVPDVLALRGRGAQLLRAPAGARGVARDRRPLHPRVRDLRRLGDVRLHQRGPQAVGRLPGGDRRRDLGAAHGRGQLGGVGALQARDRRGLAQVRRLDHRVPRSHARGRRRARADRDGRLVGGGQAHQARARPQQRHEPRQADARRGLRMSIFRLGDQRPPEPRRINDDVVMRFDHVYEVDPDKMRVFPQQDLPAWDTERIVAARWDHLDWMHDHFADEVLSTGLESETMPEEEG